MPVKTRLSASARLLAALAALAGAALPALAQEGEAAGLRGRVWRADGGTAAGARVHARAGAWADSAAADSAGRFALRLPAGRERDSVEVRVEGTEGHHPSLARMTREAAAGGEHGFVLVPRAWTIGAGRHAGTRVEIAVERAFARPCEGCSAFWIRSGPGSDSTRRAVRSWPEGVFPLRVAFDRENSASAISSRDSAAFWRIVGEVEEDFGEDLFRPAPLSATLPQGGGDAPDDVVLVWIEPNLPYSGLGTTGGSAGTITFGALWLQRSSQITASTGPQIVAHELTHTLGFGHTCAWASVLADPSRCRGLQADAPTAADVAYAQVFRRVRSLQRTHGARWGLEAALAGLHGEQVRAREVPVVAPVDSAGVDSVGAVPLPGG